MNFSVSLNHFSVITIASRVAFIEHFQLLTVSKLELPFSSSAAGGLQLLSSASRNICGHLFMLIVCCSVEYFGKLQSHSKISPVGTSVLLWTSQSALHCHADSVGCRITCHVVPSSSKHCWSHTTAVLWSFLFCYLSFLLQCSFSWYQYVNLCSFFLLINCEFWLVI